MKRLTCSHLATERFCKNVACARGSAVVFLPLRIGNTTMTEAKRIRLDIIGWSLQSLIRISMDPEILAFAEECGWVDIWW